MRKKIGPTRRRNNKKNRVTRRKNRYLKKGGTIEVDIRQILLTKPIINAIKEYDINQTINLDEFKLSKGEQGFKLPRMDRMIEANLDELEPVELKIARTVDGKIIGTKIDGQMKKMYEIVNGRHRIARSIIDGRKFISANII